MNRSVARSSWFASVRAQTLAMAFVLASSSASALPTDAVGASNANGATNANDAETLARDTAASQRWYFGWLSFLAVATGVNGALWATTDDASVRAHARMGTLIGGVGLVARAILAPPSLFSSTPEGDLLARRASAERFGRSAFAHLGGVLLNGAGALYLWLHDDLPARAAFLFGSGVLVSELMIFTQPTAAMDAVDARPKQARMKLDVAPLILKSGAGLSFSIVY
jgi:hypothetical protein